MTDDEKKRRCRWCGEESFFPSMRGRNDDPDSCFPCCRIMDSLRKDPNWQNPRLDPSMLDRMRRELRS